MIFHCFLKPSPTRLKEIRLILNKVWWTEAQCVPSLSPVAAGDALLNSNLRVLQTPACLWNAMARWSFSNNCTKAAYKTSRVRGIVSPWMQATQLFFNYTDTGSARSSPRVWSILLLYFIPSNHRFQLNPWHEDPVSGISSVCMQH